MNQQALFLQVPALTSLKDGLKSGSVSRKIPAPQVMFGWSALSQ